MIFIETPVFTKRLRDLLDDESYAAFQQDLADSPKMGDVIQGTGGLRKVLSGPLPSFHSARKGAWADVHTTSIPPQGARGGKMEGTSTSVQSAEKV